MLDQHEQQEAELKTLANTKCLYTLSELANQAVPTDCGFDEYHETVVK